MQIKFIRSEDATQGCLVVINGENRGQRVFLLKTDANYGAKKQN